MVAGAGQDDEIVHGEVFGPLLTAQPFVDEAQALRLANGSRNWAGSSKPGS